MKKKTEEIDEKALLRSIYANKNPIENSMISKDQQQEKTSLEDFQEVPSPPSKERGVIEKRKESEDYQRTFLKKNKLKARQCVYISLSIHEKILKIVRSFANHEITVGGYIDTVLCDHLETNKEEINKLYRQFKEQDDTIL